MANKAIIDLKQKHSDDILVKLKEAKSTIFVDYRGLTVDEITELRAQLNEAGVEMKVYKNSLTRRACAAAKFEGLDEVLTGPNALTFSEDVVAPAKILSEFAKKHENLVIKMGIIEGKVSGLDVIGELAQIPSYEGLLTMLAGGMIQYVKDLSVALNLYAETKEEAKPEVKEVKEEAKPEVKEAKEEVKPEAEEKTEEVVEETVEEKPEEQPKKVVEEETEKKEVVEETADKEEEK